MTVGFSSTSITWLDALVRLLLAVSLGACIGWERESEHKSAGLRTHMLVSLGAALFILSSLQVDSSHSTSSATVSSDPSRVIQGIVTGIGFLGGGEIFSKQKSQSGEIRVRGLTSAAAIWLSAALGTAAGMGFWFVGVVGALMALIILWGVKKIE